VFLRHYTCICTVVTADGLQRDYQYAVPDDTEVDRVAMELLKWDPRRWYTSRACRSDAW
jgi:hypothetical protein